MCQSAIALVTKSLHTIDNDEKLLKIKGVIALFIQTMDVGVTIADPSPKTDSNTGLGLLCGKS